MIKRVHVVVKHEYRHLFSNELTWNLTGRLFDETEEHIYLESSGSPTRYPKYMIEYKEIK